MNRISYSISIATILIGGLIACSNELAPEVAQETPPDPLALMLTGELCGKPTEVGLWAMCNQDVGQVSVSNDENRIYLEIEAGGDWQILRSNVSVARTPREIPQTRSGIPRVGQFELRTLHKPMVPTFTYEFDRAEDDFQVGDEIVFAVHTVLYRNDRCWWKRWASAWAGKERFPGRSLANYFYYTVQECTEPEPPPPPPGSCLITIESPNGGELVRVGSIYTVTWFTDVEACGTHVAIDLFYYDNYWLTITDSAPNFGFYDWNVASGNVDGDGFSIRVTDLESGTYDLSDDSFSIQVYTLPQ